VMNNVNCVYNHMCLTDFMDLASLRPLKPVVIFLSLKSLTLTTYKWSVTACVANLCARLFCYCRYLRSQNVHNIDPWCQ